MKSILRTLSPWPDHRGPPHFCLIVTYFSLLLLVIQNPFTQHCFQWFFSYLLYDTVHQKWYDCCVMTCIHALASVIWLRILPHWRIDLWGKYLSIYVIQELLYQNSRSLCMVRLSPGFQTVMLLQVGVFNFHTEGSIIFSCQWTPVPINRLPRCFAYPNELYLPISVHTEVLTKVERCTNTNGYMDTVAIFLPLTKSLNSTFAVRFGAVINQ